MDFSWGFQSLRPSGTRSKVRRVLPASRSSSPRNNSVIFISVSPCLKLLQNSLANMTTYVIFLGYFYLQGDCDASHLPRRGPALALRLDGPHECYVVHGKI